MKTISVIGASGFLGIQIVSHLLASGYKVNCINHRTVVDVPGCNSFHIYDLVNGNVKTDSIIFAAGNFANTHQELIELNCDLVRRLTLRYAESRFILISSVNVYGIHTGVISEGSAYNAPAAYGMSKLAAEFIVSGCKTYGIVRLPYLYGPNLKNKSFLPTIIASALQKGAITLMEKVSAPKIIYTLPTRLNFVLKP